MPTISFTLQVVVSAMFLFDVSAMPLIHISFFILVAAYLGTMLDIAVGT